MASLGYISAFDGLTIVDGSTKKARNPVGDTDIARVLLSTLPNGTKLNYDGPYDSDLSPGSATQVMTISTAGTAFYDSLLAKKGNQGEVTKTLLSTGSVRCTGILSNVQILGDSLPQIGHLVLAINFEFETSWS